MNKKISIGIVLILYTALAGIPSVLAYLQEKNIIVPSYGVSCGSCHVDPSVNTPEKTNLTRSLYPKELMENELPQPAIDKMGMPQLFYPGIIDQIGVFSLRFISSMPNIPEIRSISKKTPIVVVQYPKTANGTLECELCHKDPQNLIGDFKQSISFIHSKIDLNQ